MIENTPLFFSARVGRRETDGAEERRGFEMKLWIIGNGFDLYHGLKTSYADYKAYLCYHHACCPMQELQKAKTHELGWTVCKGCGKRLVDCPVCKFNALPRAELKENLWCDLEAACAIDLKKLMDEIKWDAVDGAMESPSVTLLHGKLDFAGKFAGSDFYKWLCVVEKTLSSIKVKHLEIDEEDWFLTFNYTSTLQKVYDISSDHVFYIHGKLKDVEEEYARTEECERDISLNANAHSHLLFGSPEITDAAIDDAIDYFKTFRETSPEEMQELRKHLKVLSGNLKKDIQDKLLLVKRWVLARCEDLSSFEEVVVAGHSLGKYDGPYLDLLADAFRSVKWRFMVYSEEDRRNAYEFCAQHRLHGYCVPWDTAGFEYVHCPKDWGVPNTIFHTVKVETTLAKHQERKEGK